VFFSLSLSTLHFVIEEYIFKISPESVALNNAIFKAQERERFFNIFLEESKTELLAIRTSDIFKNYLHNQNDEQAKKLFKDFFITFANANKNFMQIRFLDKNGYEKIRLDRKNFGDKPYIVSEDKLQNKSHRYYFTESKNRQIEEIWFSDLDLNIENKKIETPFKPTLRAMLPVINNGDFNGVLVLNYFMGDFLKEFTNAPLYNSILLDQNGNSISHYENNKSWSFYRNSHFNLSKEFPEYYKKMISSEFIQTDFFVSKKLNLEISNQLFLVLQLNSKFLTQQKEFLRNQHIYLTLLIFIFSFTLAYLISKILLKVIFDLDENRKLNEKLNVASEVAKIGFWEYKADSSIIKWEKSVYDIFELDDKSAEINYAKFLSFLSKKEQERLSQVFFKSIQEKKEYFIIHSIQTEKNSIKYVEERGRHFFDQNNNLIKTVGSVYDITDRFLSEEKYKLILNLASDGIFIMDLDGKLLECSHKSAEMLGYKTEEMENLTVYDWDKEITEDVWRHLSKSPVGNLLNIKRIHTRKDGSTYDADITASRIMIQQKFYIYASVRDITQEKLDRKKIIQQKNELEAIFETALEGIALIDVNTRKYLKINKKFLELLGYTSSEIKEVTCLDLTTPKYKNRMLEVYDQVVEQGYYENFERECITKKGEIKRFRSSIVLMPNKKEFLMTTMDFTELYNAYTTIKEQAYLDELTKLHNRKAYNEKLDEFLAQFKRHKTTFSMVLFDIDFFKMVNDNFGHDIGDEVLIELSNLVKNSIRQNDSLFRIGGEEFVILLFKTNEKDTLTLSEKIRKKVQNELKVIENKTITISMGASEVRENDTKESIFKRVDNNLYYAKENGRNRVVSEIPNQIH
jgi:diguanylate cyclase (GGDEF)-like protein/PAS domain S-box-containing protein